VSAAKAKAKSKAQPRAPGAPRGWALVELVPNEGGCKPQQKRRDLQQQQQQLENQRQGMVGSTSLATGAKAESKGPIMPAVPSTMMPLASDGDGSA